MVWTACMKKIVLAVNFILLAFGALCFTSQPDGLLHVYFLNVGQGDAILARTSAGENILIDGGPGQKVLTELNDALPFFDKTIDYAILTHADQDHIEGLIAVLKRYPVKNIMFSAAIKKGYFTNDFLQTIKDKRIRAIAADENADIALADNAFADILFPFSKSADNEGVTDNASVAIKLTYGKNSVLLTGDAETEEEELLAQRADIDSDVLKVGHHGSKTSSTDIFLQKVTPEYCVISAGKDNKFSHPHKIALQRLNAACKKILRTDLQGRIEFVFSAEKIVKIVTEK